MIPNGISFMMLPLIFYLYFNRNKVSYSILLVIYLILIPFSHPLTTIMLFVFFLTIELSKNLYYRKNLRYKISINSLLILLITFFTWISTSYIFARSLSNLGHWIRGELYAPSGTIVLSLDKLKLSLSERIILFLKMYGSELILISLSILACYILLKKFRSGSNYQDGNIFAIFGCEFVAIILFFVFMFTGDPNFQAMRSLTFIFFLTVPLGGYGLSELIKIIKSLSFKKYLITTFMIIFILTAGAMTGFLALYDSPNIYQPSAGVMKSELSGWNWFFQNKVQSNYTYTQNNLRLEASSSWRYSEMLYGCQATNDSDVGKYEGWEVVPDNLGYDSYKNLGANYSNYKYFPLLKKDELSYTEIWYKVGRYNKKDFDKLQSDISVFKIYSSGDQEIWFIKPNNTF